MGCGTSFSTELHQFDVFGARPLGATPFCIGDLLAFLKIVEFDALKGFGMKEDVFVRRRLDESESFVRQLFDCAFGHEFFLNGIFEQRPTATIAEGQ